MDSNKIVQIHWIGRLGNRLFQYAFCSCYAKKYGLTYYIPSEWEGSHLFVENEYCKIQPDDTLRLKINQTHPEMDTFSYRKSVIEEYMHANDDKIEFVDWNSAQNIGKKNVWFDDLNMMYFPHIFETYDVPFVKELYTFSDAVKSSKLYQTLERRKKTYNVVHLRRGDIATKSYKGAHSMISKESYIKAIKKFGYDPDTFIWISDNPNENTGHAWSNKCKHGEWKYPTGEKHQDDIFFDFFPDFLIIHFAKVIFRGNSAFSWWASFLSDADNIYSPVLKNKPSENKGKFYEMDCEFVEGNHPHFMGSSGEGFHDIII